MLLKFYARAGLVREPGRRPFIGQVTVYLGREFVAPTADGRAQYPATKDGFVWDTAKHAHPDNEHVMKHARKGAFWPADKATADACRMAFVDVEFKDGAFAEKTNRAASAASSRASKGALDG